MSDDVHVIVLVADYVGGDSAGKINAIGMGFALAGQVQGGQVNPQHVLVIAELPSSYAGSDVAFGITLVNESTGEPVKMPNAAGLPEDLRVQQVIRAHAIQAPGGVYLPSNLPIRLHASIGFPNGLPLDSATSYSWKAEINGHTSPAWRATFYVPGPWPAPVIGGTSSPVNDPQFPPIT